MRMRHEDAAQLIPFDAVKQALGEKIRPRIDERIVVDAPPFGVVGDVVSLAVMVDSVIIMCCPDRTHFKPIQFCSRSLTEAGANILGAIVNDIEVSSASAFAPHSHSHGYHKYGYGYGYGYYGYGASRSRDDDDVEPKSADAAGTAEAEEASAGLDVSGFEVNEEHPEIIEEGYRQLTKAIKMSRDETDGHCHGIFYWAPESRPGGYNLGAFGSDNRPTKIMQAYVEAAAEAANK